MPHPRPTPAASTDLDEIQFTTTGGLAIRLYNNTGSAIDKGTAVTSSTANDMSVVPTGADGYDCIGFVWEDVDDTAGGNVWVVVSGIAECLLDDADAATRGDWARVSASTAGRITTSAAPSPPTDATHFREVGHVLETQAQGTDVLVKVAIHFL